jgi:uncharacterized protein with HEPN domain
MSPPESRDLATVVDMIRACESAMSFINGMDEQSFDRDVRAVSAVNYQIAILGEAVTRLSPSLRDRYAQVPWRDIKGMRNHLIHGYDQVPLAEVWEVVKRDVPALIEQLRAIEQDLASV